MMKTRQGKSRSRPFLVKATANRYNNGGRANSWQTRLEREIQQQQKKKEDKLHLDQGQTRKNVF